MMRDNGPLPELYWTHKMVESYLEDAAEVMKALPRVKVQGYFTTWPTPIHDFWDIYNSQDDEVKKRWRPTPRQISQMEYVCEWLRAVPVREGKIIWRRASGVPWKVIAHEQQSSRSSVSTWYNMGIGKIVARLNAHDPTGEIIRRYHPF